MCIALLLGYILILSETSLAVTVTETSRISNHDGEDEAEDAKFRLGARS
jgi:hypothetical protein